MTENKEFCCEYRVCRTAISLLLRYFTRNLLAKLPALFRLAERLDKGQLYEAQIRTLRALMSDERGVWYRFTDDLFKNMNRRCLRRLTESFLLNASLSGGAAAREAELRYGCRIPWAILMDPTSACNLSCVGCWAAQYGSKSSLSYELMDSICRQGKRLGVHFYLFSGGEPLVRKTDLLRLCRAHRDCYFLSFTNGTLADDASATMLARVRKSDTGLLHRGRRASTDLPAVRTYLRRDRRDGPYARARAAFRILRLLPQPQYG
jgi:uncharacterized Fe-S cluster-containing radical SAM superfamily protein